MAFADDLLNAIIDRTVDVSRLEAHLIQLSNNQLNAMHRRLLRLIGNYQNEPHIHSEAKAIIDATFESVRTEQAAQQSRLARAELTHTLSLINTTAQYELVRATVSDSVVEEILRSASVFGAADKDWWRRQSRRTKERFSDTVRQGVLLGRSNDAIARVWRDEANLSMRQATTQVRTATNNVMNRARARVANGNRDVIKGFTVVATLDMRTSATCRAYDGMAWDLDRKPLTEHTTLPYPGPPPYHWNCRSAWVPVVKSFAEITNGRIQSELPPGIRESMDGAVPEDTTYDRWFKAQPEARQLEILGATKLSLYRKGRLSFADMVDQRGNELTIDELERKTSRRTGG